MRKFFVVVFFWISSSLLPFCLAETFASSSLAPVVKESKRVQVSLLFTVQANQGVLKQISKNKYSLSVPINDIKKILIFSDRPNRIAATVSPEYFAKLVHHGKSSFERDPPNAVVSFANSNLAARAYEVVSYQKENDLLVYSLSLLGGGDAVPRQQGRFIMFIDTVPAYITYQNDMNKGCASGVTSDCAIAASLSGTSTTVIINNINNSGQGSTNYNYNNTASN